MNVKLDSNIYFMRKTLFTFITALIIITGNANAQLVQDSIKTNPGLGGQFQLLLTKSKTLDGYKLINPSRLSLFWKNVRDSLTGTRRQLLNSKLQATKYQAEITALKKQITGTKTSLASSNAKLNEISFIGLSFTKTSYNIFVWGFIGILITTLLIILFRSVKNVQEAKYRTALYEEVNQEYQNYKIKANDKEKKLARELQDERNKLEDLRNLR
jgi:heme exporter protein D